MENTKPKENAVQLTKALIEFQSKFTPVKKNAVNPDFKSKYTDLNAIWDAIRGPLSDLGLCIVQVCRPSMTQHYPAGGGTAISETDGVILRTWIKHISGEEIYSDLPIVFDKKGAKNAAQAFGSALTYARRYAIVSLLGLSQEDDDGNSAGKQEEKPRMYLNKDEKQAIKDWKEKVTAHE